MTKRNVILGTVGVLAVLAVIGSATGGGTDDDGLIDPQATAQVYQPTPETQPGLTSGQRNAVEKAQDYLNYTPFSRTGLIDQLGFEGFSVADATFAVDSLDVDWNEQAKQKALDYLDYTSFSLSGLAEQLEFEGFTAAQAQYGASAAYGQ